MNMLRSQSRTASLEALNAKLLAALKHAHDSEVDGWLDDEEPSWMTEARAVIAEAEAAK